MTIIQASLPMPFNARREALIIAFAYHSLLKLDKSGKTQISASRPWQANQRKKGQNRKKRTASDLTAPQRSLTASRAHFCTFEARPPARAIPPPSWSSAPPVRDRPARRTTTRPPLFLRTTHQTALFIKQKRPRT